MLDVACGLIALFLDRIHACKALKEEFKRRGLLTAAGERFTVTRSDQVSSRLDVTAVKQFLGDAWRKFETASITTVIRIRAAQQLPAAA
jgi:hypothetical protein